MARDFHVDYKNCLEKSFDTLQPFGDIPQTISRMIVQSVGSANVLLQSLDQGGKILGDAVDLPIDTLSAKCEHALVKMNYCASCKGHSYHHSRPCYGFCSNVVRFVFQLLTSNKFCSIMFVSTNIYRGCLTHFLGGLDTDWTSFSEAVERLVTLVRNKDGIESVIKNLDGKLSEAIMHAMTNGPELEKKVSHVQNIFWIKHRKYFSRSLFIIVFKPRDVANFSSIFSCVSFLLLIESLKNFFLVNVQRTSAVTSYNLMNNSQINRDEAADKHSRWNRHVATFISDQMSDSFSLFSCVFGQASETKE